MIVKTTEPKELKFALEAVTESNFKGVVPEFDTVWQDYNYNCGGTPMFSNSIPPFCTESWMYQFIKENKVVAVYVHQRWYKNGILYQSQKLLSLTDSDDLKPEIIELPIK